MTSCTRQEFRLHSSKMSSSWKNILLVLGLVMLVGGIVFLALNILRMDKSGNPTPTPPTNQTSTESTPESLATTETTTPSAEALTDRGCKTSAECVIVPTAELDENGNEMVTNHCVSNSYKENCQNCSVSPEALALNEKKLTRACICSSNYCQFEQTATQ
jgi:hypothetical protein